MQQTDDQRRSSRPSLLSEQPSSVESHSILSKLDGRGAPATPKRAPANSGGRSGKLVALAAVLAVGGGALAWMLGEDGTQAPVLPAPVAPVAVAASAPPAPPPALVLADAAGATKAEPEVSAATILEDVPAGAKDELTDLLNKPAAPEAKLEKAAAPEVKLDKPAAPEDQAGKVASAEVKLDKPAAPEDKSDKPKVAAAKDAEPAKPAARKKTETAKVARKDKSPAKEKKSAVAAAPKKKPAPKAEPAVDSDVALLAALLAHSKASSAPKLSKTATEYKRCGTLASVAEADKCRERLCEATSKAKAECKTLRVAKVSG